MRGGKNGIPGRNRNTYRITVQLQINQWFNFIEVQQTINSEKNNLWLKKNWFERISGILIYFLVRAMWITFSLICV